MTDPTRAQLERNIAYVRARIFTLENEFVQASLLPAYRTAFAQLKQKLDDAWTRYVSAGEWKASDRWFALRTKSLLDEVDAEMERLGNVLHDQLIAAQVRAYRASFYGQAWIVDTQTGGLAQLPLLPDEAIRAILLYPYEGSSQLFRLEANRADFIGKLRASLVQSQIQGETIYQAQKRLADALGLDIGRGTRDARAANQGNFARTEMIARTELLRSSNLGAMAVYDRNKDVVKEWEFLATLDLRRKPGEICGRLDGKRFPLTDTAHVPPLHPNCRCTPLPVTVSFAELGLTTKELEPGRRASQSGSIRNQTYSDWAQANSVRSVDDGGLASLAASRPPRSPGAAPARVRR